MQLKMHITEQLISQSLVLNIQIYISSHLFLLSVQRKTYTLSKRLWLANHADELVVAVLYLPDRQLKFIGKMFFDEIQIL